MNSIMKRLDKTNANGVYQLIRGMRRQKIGSAQQYSLVGMEFARKHSQLQFDQQCECLQLLSEGSIDYDSLGRTSENLWYSYVNAAWLILKGDVDYPPEGVYDA